MSKGVSVQLSCLQMAQSPDAVVLSSYLIHDWHLTCLALRGQVGCEAGAILAACREHAGLLQL